MNQPATPAERIIECSSTDEARILLGPFDSHLKKIREAFGVRATARQGRLRLEGEESAVLGAHRVLEDLLGKVRKFGRLRAQDVQDMLHAASRSADQDEAPHADPVLHAKRPLLNATPRTPGQAAYAEMINQRDIVIAVGPAGTGKTFLAVANALRALRAQEVRKLVLTRPAVEAGERLGFLPGDFQQKVNPYLRPLYDALGALLSPVQLRKYVDLDVIEVAPLAYMRGRTLENAFIILDEGQNATALQMKMFLTRVGCSSKVVITGDITQVDLPRDEPSGLVEALAVLRGIKGIGFAFLTERDIVRHPLVRDIVAAYSRDEDKTSDTDDAAQRPTRSPEPDGAKDHGDGVH